MSTRFENNPGLELGADITVGTDALISIRNASYQWTASGSGTNEFYLEAAGGGDPGLSEPADLYQNGTIMAAGTVGSLSASEWDYGDNDTLGFSTIYVRLSDGADPDSKAADYVEYSATDVINVAVQLEDWLNQNEMGERASIFAYLSDDANGDSIAATAPSGGVAIGTDGLLIPVVANKAFQLISEADGDIDINITEADQDTWYLVLVMPNGRLVVSGAIAFDA